MVRVCCVSSCKVFWFPNSDVSFFAFPLNNEELKEKWINAAPGYKTLSKYSAICNKHFLPQDYTESGGKMRLNKDAVPSLFGSQCLETPDRQPEIFHFLNHDVETQTFPSNVHLIVARESPALRKRSDVAVQTCPRLSGPSELEKELRAKIKLLQERLRRRERRITNVEGLVAHLKKNGRCSENLEEKFLGKFTKFDLDLFKNEANNNGVGKNKKTYTQEMKEFAISLYYCSPKAYKFVRDKINLPHAATLRRWIAEAGKFEKLQSSDAEIREDIAENVEIGESSLEYVEICEISANQVESCENIVEGVE